MRDAIHHALARAVLVVEVLPPRATTFGYNADCRITGGGAFNVFDVGMDAVVGDRPVLLVGKTSKSKDREAIDVDLNISPYYDIERIQSEVMRGMLKLHAPARRKLLEIK